MSTLIHIHVPGDAPGLDEVLREVLGDSDKASVIRRGDSYREWGEAFDDHPDRDDAKHVIIETSLDFANIIWNALAERGIPVNATLEEDYTAAISWGLGNPPKGWVDRYRPELRLVRA